MTQFAFGRALSSGSATAIRVKPHEKGPLRPVSPEKLATIDASELGLNPPDLLLDGSEHQVWEGFGGCFNELGWTTLSALKESDRNSILQALFSSRRFSRCRVPIGANDYAIEWYSHNENAGDYAMSTFSIKRDEEFLLPYIRAAIRIEPDLKLFASPWSPPTWMKSPKAYNHGSLIWRPEMLQAYALYFHKFVEAYRLAGIPVDQVHVQNEPDSDQKFPSCTWTSQQIGEFIRDYLGPLFAQHPPKDKNVKFGRGRLKGATTQNGSVRSSTMTKRVRSFQVRAFNGRERPPCRQPT